MVERGLVRAFDKAVRRKPLARRTRWGYGDCMWAKDVLGQQGKVSELADRAVGGCCRVVALILRRMKPGIFRRQDTREASAAGHAKFSKWDRDFILQLSTPWVGSEVGFERQLIAR